uniref:Uncharacterized protein n=1 Tax=uncultured Nocardioidaceae bacterium TaxID=253824 RepID=A0A6J4KRJ6_9ACTN|nr:MAG: hypothetical protein AVDCRST_MAG46-176 [uncultured Nocardioidaceae bacterium]
MPSGGHRVECHPAGEVGHSGVAEPQGVQAAGDAGELLHDAHGLLDGRYVEDLAAAVAGPGHRGATPAGDQGGVLDGIADVLGQLLGQVPRSNRDDPAGHLAGSGAMLADLAPPGLSRR